MASSFTSISSSRMSSNCGAAGLDLFARLDDALEPRFQLDVRHVDDLAVHGCRLGRQVAGGGFLRGGLSSLQPAKLRHAARTATNASRVANAIMPGAVLPTTILPTTILRVLKLLKPSSGSQANPVL